MDREQFDVLARLVWTRTSRRTSLSGLIGAVVEPRSPLRSVSHG